MANLLEDIQCAGSDTRPPMLDRTDFASWQQRIRLYCRGKDNGVNILKSIDEGPYKLGTFRETLAESTEGTPQFGPERPHVYSDLKSEEKDRYNADIRATNILLQGLPKDIYTLINHYTDAKDIWDNVRMLLEGCELTKEDRESQLYDYFEHFKQHKEESIHDYYVRFAKLINDMRNIKMTMSKLQLNSKFVNNMLPEWDKMMLMQAQENEVALDAEQLLFLAGGLDNTFDDDVNEQPIQDLALNVDNVFQAKDCDAFDSDVDETPTAQTMFMANLSSTDPVTDKAGPSYDLDILSEIDEQLRLVISDRNFKEETLKHELHSTKLQLASTINRNKSMVEETTFLKQDFKQKENKYLADFLNMKSLKEKVEDKLVKQDQSLQTVHMLCRPRPLYNNLNKVSIGYKNPLCLTRAKQAQPALYNGHEILKDNHASAKVQNTEDTLEIAEITRKKMNAKMTNPECVTHKVKIAPHDYSKENLLATFTPQKQLTPELIYWSNDLMKLKSKALKERAKVSRPIKAFTV
nr:integrase, catalytic region, zinc finger, CCHC-type, peptidase aspartic, catalytic [Tanacetum cinerariifolium]